MKKSLFITIIIALLASCVFAQEFKPYGSARIGYWYDMQSKEMTGNKADLDLNYGLQSNSRFGVSFTKDNLQAKVEYGAKVDGTSSVNLRLLYAKYAFNDMSLLIGQDYDGTNEYASQVYGDDANLIGFGAVDGGRNPQIKAEFKNGLYFSLIKPAFTASSGFSADSSDVLIPRINIGYKFNHENIYIHPSFVLQQTSYSKDDNSDLSDDVSALAYLFAVTGQMKMDAITLRAQANYGSNTGNMGYKGPSNKAKWMAADQEFSNTSTLGGFAEASYALSKELVFNTGFGYASSSNDEWDKDDAQASMYVQAKIKIQSLQLIPEIGIQDKMKNNTGVKEGNKTYFGTQLRMDF
jgi:hypothetical protein